jgi:hypothetical protein
LSLDVDEDEHHAPGHSLTEARRQTRSCLTNRYTDHAADELIFLAWARIGIATIAYVALD